MLVCCSGMARSGSTWAYNVCRLIVETTGAPSVAGYYGEAAELDSYIRERGLVAHAGHVVLKLHQPGAYLLELILTGAAHNVFTIRDPRDCLCSRMRFEGKAFDDALVGVVGNLLMYNCYETAANSLFVLYDEMVADPRAQIGRIAAHLGIALTDAQLEAIHESTCAERAQQIVRDLDSRPAGSVVEVGARKLDPRTCLQTGHLAGGRTGRWREELDQAERLTATAVLRDWLVRLGYEDARALDARIEAGFGLDEAAAANAPLI